MSCTHLSWVEAQSRPTVSLTAVSYSSERDQMPIWFIYFCRTEGVDTECKASKVVAQDDKYRLFVRILVLKDIFSYLDEKQSERKGDCLIRKYASPRPILFCTRVNQKLHNEDCLCPVSPVNSAYYYSGIPCCLSPTCPPHVFLHSHFSREHLVFSGYYLCCPEGVKLTKLSNTFLH